MESTALRRDEPSSAGGIGGKNASESPGGNVVDSAGSGGTDAGGMPCVPSPGGKLPAAQLLEQRSQTVSTTGFQTFFLTVLSLRTNTLTVFTQQSDGEPQTILWCGRAW
jgi:hypothetical protein